MTRSSSGTQPSRRSPHILFIFTDDQRFDTISALGNPEIATPNLDRLARRGTVFTHAHIMGSMTPAVCIPSRAMMLTGRALCSLEQDGRRIPREHTALPEWLRQNGYVTSHIGKWHQDRESHARCFSTGDKIFGFNSRGGWYEVCNGHWHVPVHDFDPSGRYSERDGYHAPPIEPFEAPFETTKTNGRHSVEVFTDAAIDFLRTYPTSEAGARGEPFFLYLAHVAPHDPRQYPERLRERYHADAVSLPENFAVRHPFDNGALLVRDELLEAHPRRPAAVRQHLADYYALIALIDEHVGRLLAALEETGQADNTLIVFSGDNGLAVGQHGLMGKQNLYEHSVRVPLVMAGPGVPEEQTSSTFCYLHDLFPTLCELAGLTIPPTVEGRSLVPALRDPSAAIRDTLHFAYRDVQRGVRVGDDKLIEYTVNGVRNTQLFDLASDPRETRNLAADPGCEETLDALRNRLGEWRTEMNDVGVWGQAFWHSM
ncbi:MAG: sulfatase-like hydrolase/transferase [Phycisphaerae bacterium]|nr:sulfatase-like hydrolase/transferase [Phycisphaerae bacterium]